MREAIVPTRGFERAVWDAMVAYRASNVKLDGTRVLYEIVDAEGTAHKHCFLCFTEKKAQQFFDGYQKYKEKK